MDKAAAQDTGNQRTSGYKKKLQLKHYPPFCKTFGKQEFTRDITTPHISPFLKLLFKHAQITEESVVIKNDSSNSQEEFIQLDDSDEEDDTLSFKSLPKMIHSFP